jgi:hypothetical protein
MVPSLPVPSLDEMVARNLAALGGADRLRRLQSLRRSGTATMTLGEDTSQGPFLAEMKRPLRLRSEMSVSGLKAMQAFDGTSGWTLDEETGATRRMNEGEVRRHQAESQFDPWLLDFRQRGITVEDLGPAEVDSIRVRKLKVTFGGQAKHLYLNARTYLELRCDRLDETGAPRDSTLTRGYTTVQGLKLAKAVEVTYARGPARLALRYEKTEIDPDIPDSRFLRP